MSLKPKQKQKLKLVKDSEPPKLEGESKYDQMLRIMHNYDRKHTIIPPMEVDLSIIQDSLRLANKGARRLHSFEIDPKSIQLLPYDREPEYLLIKAKIKKSWEEHRWYGDRMTSKLAPIEDIEERHTSKEQMPYYFDLAKNHGILLEKRYVNVPDVYFEGKDCFVEFVFKGFESIEYVKRKTS